MLVQLDPARGVALGDEPVGGRHVAPPFADHAGGVVLEERVFRPFRVAAFDRIRHLLDLAAPDELEDVARTVERAVHDLHVVAPAAQ